MTFTTSPLPMTTFRGGTVAQRDATFGSEAQMVARPRSDRDGVNSTCGGGATPAGGEAAGHVDVDHHLITPIPDTRRTTRKGAHRD